MSAASPSSLLSAPPQPLGRFLLPSLLVHALLFGLVLGYGALTARPMLDLDQKPIRATLVRQGTPRDEKLLPRIEEPPPPPKEQASAPAPAPLPAVVPAPPAAPAKTKAPGEKTGDDRQKLLGAFDRLSKSKRPPETSGALDGDVSGDSAEAEGERYYGQLSVQVKRFYDVSETIPDEERIRLVAQVALFIDPSGQLARFRLVKSSGNDLFDGAVLGAVKRAAPFAPPPGHLRNALQKYGIVLQFRP
ncbi:MAG: energy transducer TonB [Myxococcaceae bacterium]